MLLRSIMIKVVVIGGGKGQSALLRGLKNIEDIHLTAIVTVADDGGSTGRLREEFDIPGMGDIRNVMVALAESETMISQIMNYRFDESKRSSLAGHNLGNLILTALTEESGSFMGAVTNMSKVLNVKGDVFPASTDVITLCARMEDGTIVRGESNIPKYLNSIEEVYYDVVVEATKESVAAIQSADIILFGVGSLYTSIIPNVIIPEINEAIRTSKAKKVYYCNAMSQPGETEGYTGEGHVDAIIKHGVEHIDLVVRASDEVPEDVIRNYQEEGSHMIRFAHENHDYAILSQELLEFKNRRIRHSHTKVSDGFKEILEALECPLAVK